MKRIYQIIAFVTLTLTISSCSKDFLETESPNLDLENYFVSEQKAGLALIGCYDMLGKEFDPSGSNYNMFPYFFGDIIGHDALKGGEGPGDQAFLEPLITFNYEPTNPGLPGPYSNYYIAINRCNRVLDSVPVMSEKIISNDKKIQIVAEAKFLRGYFYFELLKMFGPVPVVVHVLHPGSYNLPRPTNVSQVWSQIESDFLDASKVLPVKSNQVKGRATRGAARAFLSKAYLYQQKWEDCLTLVDSIEQSNEFGLETNYEDNWSLSNENGIESVFEIQFKSSNTGAWGDANEGNVFNIFTTPRNWGGWGFSYPDSILFNKFENGDPRLKATILQMGDSIWNDDDKLYMWDNKDSLMKYEPTCYDFFYARKNLVPPSVMIEGDSPNNFKVIRYAEVLLWGAEAAAHLGKDWNHYLQQVRDRVNMGPTPIADPLIAVWHEREVELALEGQRLWDVIRQGRGEEVFGKYGYKESENHYFPIPAAEVNLSKW